MKRNLFYKIIKRYLLPFIVTTVLVMPVFLQAQERDVARFERKLLQKIEKYMVKVLPRASFSANVSVLATSAGTTQGDVLGGEILPGLEPLGSPYFPRANLDEFPIPLLGLGDNNTTDTAEGIMYGDNTLIKEISVDLIVDETIPDITISAVQDALLNQLDTAYPGIVNLTVTPADFSRIRLERQERLAQSRALFAPEPAVNQPSAEQQQPIIIQQTPLQEQTPIIISNIIPEAPAAPTTTNIIQQELPTDNASSLGVLNRESSLIWYGLIIFLVLLFFALILFAVLMVVLRQDRPQPTAPTPPVQREKTIIRERVQPAAAPSPSPPPPPVVAPVVAAAVVPAVALAPPPPPVMAAPPPPVMAPPPPVTANRGPNITAEDIPIETRPTAVAKRVDPYQNLEAELGFVRLFAKDPLVSRDYFLNLSNEEKSSLIFSFRSSSAQRRFNILQEGFRPDNTILEKFGENEEALEEFRKDTFRSHTRNLQDYNELVSLDYLDPISRISLLTEKEVETLFSRLSIDQLVGIASFVEGKIMLNYVKNVPEERKGELLSKLNKSPQMTSEDMRKTKQDIASRMEELSSRIFTTSAERDALNETIIRTADNSKAIVESLRSVSPSLYKRYKKYTIVFDDFLDDSTDAAVRTVDSLDNEVLSTALVNIPANKQEQILSSLAANRREIIISSVGSKRGRVDDGKIQEEREKVLETYRSFAGI